MHMYHSDDSAVERETALEDSELTDNVFSQTTLMISQGGSAAPENHAQEEPVVCNLTCNQ
jgi:hypothetical protein